MKEDEARRLQISGSSRRMKKEAGSQDLLSFESCKSSAAEHAEEMSLESPGKMQDEQEVVGETPGNATRGRGEVGWRLELEGETETLETKVFWNGAPRAEASEKFQKGKRSARERI